MITVQLQMPSQGDMVLIGQDGGVITLNPVYYGNECMGPFISVLDNSVDPPKVIGRYRISIKQDGKVTVKPGTIGGDKP